MTDRIVLLAVAVAGAALAAVIGILFWVNASLREDKAALERNVAVLQGAVVAGEAALEELRAAAKRADRALEEWSRERDLVERGLADTRLAIQDLRRSNAAVASWLDAALPADVRGLLGQTGDGSGAASGPGKNSGNPASSGAGCAVEGEDERGSSGIREVPGGGP